MSRRRPEPLGLLLAACLVVLALDRGARAQTMEHPCDNRAGWPEKSSRGDKQPVTSDDGLYFSAAFDFLTMQSDKLKSVPTVARLFNKAGVSADARNPLEKAEQVDKECAASEQEFFFQCDAVLNRVYLGVSGLMLWQGHWLVEPKGEPRRDATVKEARAALTLVCDRFDARRAAFAKRLRQDSDAAAIARAKAAQPDATAAPAYEEASMIPLPKLGDGVDPNDPRLQSMECRHLCEAYLAFGPEGCFNGMAADEKKWCLQKEQAVQADHCSCR